ncbi:MAG: Hpt domain-containing protein [Thiolinea sp.]
MTQIDSSALTRLLQVIGGDAEDLAEFIDDFAEIVPEMIHKMKSGSASNDWNTVKIAAHSLKSNSTDLGATALADLCAVIETESSHGAVTNAQLKIGQISLAAQEAISALKALDPDTL